MSSMHEFDQIDYLMRSKISALRTGQSPSILGTIPQDWIWMNACVFRMNSMFTQESFALLPLSALQDTGQGWSKRRRQPAEEALRPFNLPEASADYEHYVTLGWWSAEEAIALLLGQRSRERLLGSVVEPYVGVSPFAEDFGRLRERVVRSPLANQSGQVSPQQCIEWASPKLFLIPVALLNAANAFGTGLC